MPAPMDTDLLIVGSGIAGALLACRIAEAGHRVTILEAGAPVDRVAAIRNFQQAVIKVPECAYPPPPEAMHPVSNQPGAWLQQRGPEPFKSTYLKVLGGTTWHWLGSCPRLLPSDFAMHSTYGRAVDWPLSYEELEPHYLQAEHEIGVAGDSEANLGSPRSGPYPMPPIPRTWLDQQMAEALAASRFEVRSTPQARNSIVRDQRPSCCGSASCIPVCPVGAKYDATVHLNRALKAGAILQDRSPAVRLEVDETGKISGVHYRRWDGSSGVLRARIVVLACNAIETPRLLLASRSATLPQGVANRSDQVGRNLMDHPIQLSWALSKNPLYPYRGPLSTAGIENLREGEFRREHSAVRIEIGNDGWAWPTGAPYSTAIELAKQGLRGDTMTQALNHQISRHIRLSSLTEQEPDPNNRVILDDQQTDIYGVPVPAVEYRLSPYVTQALDWARELHEEIFKKLEVSEIHHAPAFEGAGHIMGTTRMGRDPTRSVVDAQLRSHDHPNLFIVGASVFPTAGTANPTLTIAALSLRAAETIRQQLQH